MSSTKFVRAHYGENAGATLPYQQMSSVTASYPLDRYLVDSSKKFEMVNIIDDELWNTDPALKPEEELILRKLHEMLQSTADDLKLLSGELSKFHRPGVQIKSSPTPLDDEFNEKVHIEEIVNAKFHGYKIIDKSSTPREPELKQSNDVTKKEIPLAKHNLKNTCNNNYQINTKPILKKPTNKNFGITRIKHIHIDSNPVGTKSETLNNGKLINVPVAYKEYKYNYVQPKVNTLHKELKLQEMPRINIRSELKMQKVFQLDIMPDVNEFNKTNNISKNIAVAAFKHEPSASSAVVEPFKQIQQYSTIKPTVRKVSKMSTGDSSASTSNISSDTETQVKLQKNNANCRRSSKYCTLNYRKKMNSKRDQEKRSSFSEEWKKKLNLLYGSFTSKNSKPKTKRKAKSPSNQKISHNKNTTVLNNVEYIPYSKLTIGGARASDIEKEISSIPNKHNMPLSPVLDKIVSSRDNYLKKNKRPKSTGSLKVFTTSDENLLQEVMDIERTVSETLSKSLKGATCETKCQKPLSDNEDAKDNVSYVDDFEEEKSDHSGRSQNITSNSRCSSASSDEKENNDIADDDYTDRRIENGDQQPSLLTVNTSNLTRPKISNLALKNKIDVFDYVHAIDTQETATQSNATEKITLKETQTTPRSDSNIQPIRNDLWQCMDPNGRVEKTFELEKEFIKKLIIDEYGDILKNNIIKPSSSKESEVMNNVAALQKNTQTSPARVKNVMTSPKRTKSRTTSPFSKLTVDHHTSPLILVSRDNEINVELEEEDLAISINLSSPRFSLRLPRNSQEVFSNLEDSLQRTGVKNRSEVIKSANTSAKNSVTDKKSVVKTSKNNANITTTSTSSIEADSSQYSSLGEVRLRRMCANIKNNSDCDSLCTTSSKYSSDLQSGLLHLRSEGELSVRRKRSTKHNNSEGEASLGLL